MAEGENGHESGGSVPGAVKQKLGPLPVWAWVGLAGVGIFIAFWIKNSQSSSGTLTTGQAASTNAGDGITSTDPLTADQLLQAVSQLSTQLANNQGQPTSGGGGQPGRPGRNPTGGGAGGPASHGGVHLGSGGGINTRYGDPHGIPYTIPSTNSKLQALTTSHTTGGTSTARLTVKQV